MKLVLCDWDGNRGGAGVEEEGIGCHRLYLCSPPAHSVVSLSILLSPCSSSHLRLHSVVSLFILLSYREAANARGGIRTKAVDFQKVVVTGIIFHGRYHRRLFNKVCWICPSGIRSGNNHWANV